ncbi:MAG: HAMP domain-containing protein, partial [Acidobacteriota bacterium]
MNRKRLLRKIYWISGLLSFFILVYLGSIIFLNPSSVGSPHFGRFINIWALIWTVNFLIVVLLAFILARNLIKLFFEYQAKRSGSRIKAKLVASHIVVSLFPALIMSALALGLINGTLDRWFRSPSRQLLQSAGQIELNYYQIHRQLMLAKVQEAAREYRSAGSLRNIQLSDRQQGGLQGVLLLDSEGEITAQSGEWVIPQDEEAARQAIASGFEALQQEEGYYDHRQSGPSNQGLEGSATYDYGFAGVPLRSADGDLQGVLMARFIQPQSAQFFRIGVQEAFQALGTIEDDERSLRLAYFSVLGLSTVVVVFGFVWLATYIGRRLTAPIEALATGSQELAGGNLDYRVEVEAVDELAVLV